MKRIFSLFVLLFCTVALAQTTTVPVSAVLSWTAVTTGTSGGTTVTITGVTYTDYVEVQPAGGTCSAASMTQVDTGLTATTDTLSLNLTPGSTECFGVTATAGGVTGAMSNIVTVAVPAVTPGTTTVTVTVTIT